VAPRQCCEGRGRPRAARTSDHGQLPTAEALAAKALAIDAARVDVTRKRANTATLLAAAVAYTAEMHAANPVPKPIDIQAMVNAALGDPFKR
jgi:hypothetical protein